MESVKNIDNDSNLVNTISSKGFYKHIISQTLPLYVSLFLTEFVTYVS